MRYIFFFDGNPNFPVGNKCGWLSSSQNTSFVRDSGQTFSSGAIYINSFSHDVFTKTVSLALHLYVSRGFSLNSVFELLSILFEIVLSYFLSLKTLTLSSIVKSMGSEMSEIGLVVIPTFSRCFFMFIGLLSWVSSQFSNKIEMDKLLDIESMSLSISSTREPFLSTITGISSSMFILFNTLIDKLS